MLVADSRYGDDTVARTYRLSEAGRIERVERMKRMNADPVFAARRDALSGERMKRLHADPVFAAKQAAGASKAMKRLNADAALAAKKAAARSILIEAIVTALRGDLNATRVAAQTGVVAETVRRIAKAAGVKLTRGRPCRNASEPPDSMPLRSQLVALLPRRADGRVGDDCSRNATHLLPDRDPAKESPNPGAGPACDAPPAGGGDKTPAQENIRGRSKSKQK
jgi:hypothetical protein